MVATKEQISEFAAMVAGKEKPLVWRHIAKGAGQGTEKFRVFWQYSPTFREEEHPGAADLANYIFGKDGWKWRYEYVSDTDTYYLVVTKTIPDIMLKWQAVQARVKELGIVPKPVKRMTDIACKIPY